MSSMSRFRIGKWILLLACLASAGCTPPEDFVDTLFGVKHNVAILAPAAFELSQTPVSFSPTDAEVVGKESSVCIVLAGAMSIKDTDTETQRLLNGAKLRAVVTTSSGITQNFTCLGRGWLLRGRILPSNEIMACLSPSCSHPELPVGTKVQSVTISSTAPVHALGAYWESTSAFDNRRR